MREIEFRAWLKDEKRMLNDISSIKLDIKCIYYDNNDLFSYERKSFDEIELMQYTGLKDKNGVKIFEGDIVNSYMEKCVVCWNERHCCFETRKNNSYTQLGLLSTRFLEVIGNIYENPELLGEKDE